MAEEKPRDVTREELLRYSTEIVASYLGKNKVASEQIAEVINTVFNSLSALDQNGSDEVTTAKNGARPAVPVKRSVTPEYIVCLEDGKKLKMLKRYLRTNYQMTPDDYRAKWGLPADYPMVAPNYAKQRSDFAKTIGLGRDATRKRGRKRSA
jgi:predicted transcriptional regulator